MLTVCSIFFLVLSILRVQNFARRSVHEFWPHSQNVMHGKNLISMILKSWFTQEKKFIHSKKLVSSIWENSSSRKLLIRYLKIFLHAFFLISIFLFLLFYFSFDFSTKDFSIFWNRKLNYTPRRRLQEQHMVWLIDNTCIKLVRIMLETRDLVNKYKHICSFKKITF